MFTTTRPVPALMNTLRVSAACNVKGRTYPLMIVSEPLYKPVSHSREPTRRFSSASANDVPGSPPLGAPSGSKQAIVDTVPRISASQARNDDTGLECRATIIRAGMRSNLRMRPGAPQASGQDVHYVARHACL